MKKLCYNCEFYGMCAIDNRVCKDFVPFVGGVMVGYIVQFDTMWKIKHKHFWDILDKKLLQKRIDIVKERLFKQTPEEEYIKKMEEKMQAEIAQQLGADNGKEEENNTVGKGE